MAWASAHTTRGVVGTLLVFYEEREKKGFSITGVSFYSHVMQQILKTFAFTETHSWLHSHNLSTSFKVPFFPFGIKRMVLATWLSSFLVTSRGHLSLWLIIFSLMGAIFVLPLIIIFILNLTFHRQADRQQTYYGNKLLLQELKLFTIITRIGYQFHK